MKDLKKQIIQAVKRAGRKGLSNRELFSQCKPTAKEERAFSNALRELKKSGAVEVKKGRLYSAKRMGLHVAVIDRVNQTFGFAIQQDNDQEVFIPGKFLKGALPGDTVQLRYIPARREKGLEGEVISILQYGSGLFTGILVTDGHQLAVLPDRFARFPIPLMKGKRVTGQPGDKVTAEILLRGERHADHRCRVLENFGSSQNPAACADALLKINGAPQVFSEQALLEAKKSAEQGILPKDYQNRLDLRNEIIFTIDSADSKDLDDAVSLSKLGDCYQLGVHIADVSHYVRAHSTIDSEAFLRGTSIYYADQVVPMLPKDLSNGICSLNPEEDRLAFSALLTISESGELLAFDFKKTVICSRVKGVYAEINQILEKTESEAIRQKYSGLTDTLFLMDQLATLLHANRVKRGAPEIETRESKIILQGEEVVEIALRSRGRSERMIEEFMLMANQAAATLGRTLSLPFVYRVHESPAPEKAETLKEILHTLGLPVPALKGELQPGQLAGILQNAKGGKYDALINLYVLRTMSKARYSEEPLGHFGLVLKDYAHFTSPIRRYPDLAIHRILSLIATSGRVDTVQKKYHKFSVAVALQSTHTELRAMQLERSCEDCYKAAYMANHLDERFVGVISSVAGQGIYVELPNTVEGLVRLEALGEDFCFDGLLEVKNSLGKTYRVGDELAVVCVRADVNSGQIDFELAE